MIRNVVLGRVREDVEPATVEEGLQALQTLRVDGVEPLEVLAGLDLGLRDGNAHFVITVDLPDEEAYQRYDTDPEHNRIRREVFAPICTSIERVQFQLPD